MDYDIYSYTMKKTLLNNIKTWKYMLVKFEAKDELVWTLLLIVFVSQLLNIIVRRRC